MNHDNDDNEDHDGLELPIDAIIDADDDSEGSGNKSNLDQMYRDYQHETLFMEPIRREILMQHSNDDPNVTTEE